MKEQGLFHTAGLARAGLHRPARRSTSAGGAQRGGPRRPQDRVAPARLKESFREALPSLLPPTAAGDAEGRRQGRERRRRRGGRVGRGRPGAPAARDVMVAAAAEVLDHGSVVIAAITSCTNTSNPSVMMAAGLLAKKAVERGLARKPWVKTSLAPGSKVVTEYYRAAGLLPYLERWASTWWATAAPPASATRGRCREEIADAIQPRGWWPARCSPATATSRGASTPTCAPTT